MKLLVKGLMLSIQLGVRIKIDNIICMTSSKMHFYELGILSLRSTIFLNFINLTFENMNDTCNIKENNEVLVILNKVEEYSIKCRNVKCLFKTLPTKSNKFFVKKGSQL